jgi:hypothetical protein
VQLERSGENSGTRNRRKAVGNRVALQVAGYRWLHAVQADELGVHYEELYSVLGRLHASQIYKNWKIVNSLKLMVEVLPYCGGRMLRLRSVFTIKNNTKHRLKILAKEGSSAGGLGSAAAAGAGTAESAAETGATGASNGSGTDEKESAFILESGVNFYVPLALLRRSVLASAGKSLGYLYLCPADLSIIEEELISRPNSQPGSVEYTTDPINLYQTVVKSSEAAEAEERAMRMADIDGRSGGGAAGDGEYPGYEYLAAESKDNYMQLVCHINPKLKSRHNNTRKSGAGNELGMDNLRLQEQRRSAVQTSLNKLPPFCYCVEVNSGSDYATGSGTNQKLANQNASSITSRFFSSVLNQSAQMNSPANFTISTYCN